MPILATELTPDPLRSGVTAASVALAEAGVQMYGLVVGCCAVCDIPPSSIFFTDLSTLQAFLPSIATPFLDPTLTEAKLASAFASVACIPALGTITNVGLSGVVPVKQFDEALKVCVEVCGQIHGVAKAALVAKSG